MTKTQTPTSVQKSILAQIASNTVAVKAVVAFVGELSGNAAFNMLEIVDRVDGKMICVKSFPDFLDEVPARERNPNRVTREAFLRHARKEGCQERVSLVNGDAVELADLFEPESLDMLFLAGRGGYEDQCTAFLAWHPILRQAGIVLGTGFQAAGREGGYAAIVKQSEVDVTSGHARYAITRLVMDLVPNATVLGDLWFANRGIDKEPVTVIASGMLRIKMEEGHSVRERRTLVDKMQIVDESSRQPARIAMLEQATREIPEDGDRIRALGNEYMTLGLVDEAIRTYERGIRGSQTSAGIYVDLGNAYRVKGDLETATGFLRTSTRRDGSSRRAWTSLAGIYVETGEAKQAIECIRAALAVPFDGVDSIYQLCRLSLELGDRTIMVGCFNDIRRHTPKHELARQLSDRLAEPILTIPRRP